MALILTEEQELLKETASDFLREGFPIGESLGSRFGHHDRGLVEMAQDTGRSHNRPVSVKPIPVGASDASAFSTKGIPSICILCQDPLNLVPTKIAMASRHGDWELAGQYHLTACMECGCCAYICPSRIPLVQLIRMGKAQAPRN